MATLTPVCHRNPPRRCRARRAARSGGSQRRRQFCSGPNAPVLIQVDRDRTAQCGPRGCVRAVSRDLREMGLTLVVVRPTQPVRTGGPPCERQLSTVLLTGVATRGAAADPAHAADDPGSGMGTIGQCEAIHSVDGNRTSAVSPAQTTAVRPYTARNALASGGRHYERLRAHTARVHLNGTPGTPRLTLITPGPQVPSRWTGRVTGQHPGHGGHAAADRLGRLVRCAER